MVGTRFLWWGGGTETDLSIATGNNAYVRQFSSTCRQPESVAVPADIETSCGVCSARAACKY